MQLTKPGARLLAEPCIQKRLLHTPDVGVDARERVPGAAAAPRRRPDQLVVAADLRNHRSPGITLKWFGIRRLIGGDRNYSQRMRECVSLRTWQVSMPPLGKMPAHNMLAVREPAYDLLRLQVDRSMTLTVAWEDN